MWSILAIVVCTCTAVVGLYPEAGFPSVGAFGVHANGLSKERSTKSSAVPNPRLRVVSASMGEALSLSSQEVGAKLPVV
jgi:hypothetical protein